MDHAAISRRSAEGPDPEGVILDEQDPDRQGERSAKAVDRCPTAAPTKARLGAGRYVPTQGHHGRQPGEWFCGNAAWADGGLAGSLDAETSSMRDERISRATRPQAENVICNALTRMPAARARPSPHAT